MVLPEPAVRRSGGPAVRRSGGAGCGPDPGRQIGVARFLSVSGQTTVLFDLDGTVSDGGPGMLGGLVHACRSMDLPVPSEAVLRSFLGPPFQVSFARHFGLDAPDCERAVASYREYYYAGGAMLEATPYEGIPRLLRRLGEHGCELAIATSKPEPFAVQVIEHLGLTEHFAGIFGADLEGRVTKADARTRKGTPRRGAA
jgi:phosphoglycolate phosphatase